MGWPLPLRGVAFERERRVYQAAIETALEENLKGSLTPEAFQGVQRAVAGLRRKLQAAGSSLEREDFVLARAFLDQLGAVVEPLRQPVVERVLAAIDSYAGTTVGDLVAFMQRYNLRFGPATNPDECETYHELYSALVRLRDDAVAAAADPRDLRDVGARRGADHAPPDRDAAPARDRAELPRRPDDRQPAPKEKSRLGER